MDDMQEECSRNTCVGAQKEVNRDVGLFRIFVGAGCFLQANRLGKGVKHVQTIPGNLYLINNYDFFI